MWVRCLAQWKLEFLGTCRRKNSKVPRSQLHSVNWFPGELWTLMEVEVHFMERLSLRGGGWAT